MYKVIDLGVEVASTGEPRVRTLEPSLIKTASTEIQDYWDTLSKNDKYAYLWVIGVSAMEYYGCNNNGDAFTEADLKKTIPDWTANAHIFLHHVNKDPRKSIGKPVYAWYNNEMHRVELILAIDKSANGAAAVVERIKNGEQLYVSMGCNVKYDVCSICGHQSKSRSEYCDHLRYNLKKILPDGKQVYALNPNPKFFDISIVTKPADPTAFALDKIASEGGLQHTASVLSSAELGEQSEHMAEKVAGLRKMADILKQVEGRIAATKNIQAARDIADQGFEEFDYPVMPYHHFEHVGITPLMLMMALSALRAPITLGDSYWMSGLPRMGVGMGDALHMLPDSMDMLADHPDSIGSILSRMFGGQMPPTPIQRSITIRIVQPLARKRIIFISRLNKLAEEDHIPADRNFYPIDFEDEKGNKYRTTPYHLKQDNIFNGLPERDRTDSYTNTPLLNNNKNILAIIGGMGLLASLGAKSGLGALLSTLPIAASLVMSDPSKNLKTNYTGVEVPAGTWKQSLEKTGGDPVAVAGVMAPTALALDFLYNKWSAERSGEPMEDSLMNRLGYESKEHPAVAALTGVTGAKLLQAGIKKLFLPKSLKGKK